MPASAIDTVAVPGLLAANGTNASSPNSLVPKIPALIILYFGNNNKVEWCFVPDLSK
jgi:hypothetical protein